MKFERVTRWAPITLSARKLVAFQRKQERERSALPIFTDLVASTQISPEEEEARRNALATRAEQSRRDMIARCWRACRRDYFAADHETQARIRAMWSGWAGPKQAGYYRYVVDVCTGEQTRRHHAALDRDRAIRAEVRARMWWQLNLLEGL